MKNNVLSDITWGANISTEVAAGQTSSPADQLIAALKADKVFGENDANKFAKAATAADVAKVLGDNYVVVSTGKKDDEATVAQKTAAAEEFAQVVGNYVSGEGTASAESTEGEGDNAKTVYTITPSKAGYYFVKTTGLPKDDQQQTKPNSYYTEYILRVVGQTSLDVKGDYPTVEKKVKDANDSTGKTTDWQDSADHDIHDLIDYKLTGTLPDNYASYDSYKYEFTDTLSKGLTVQDGVNKKDDNTTSADSIRVYAVNPDSTGAYTSKVEIAEVVSNAEDKTAGYEVSVKSYDKNGTETSTADDIDHSVMTVNFADLKKATAQNEGNTLTINTATRIVVEYQAQLNSYAKIGAEGNPNVVDLTYSNNPNQGGDGDTGKTPEDKVIVFTFKITVNKKDENDKDLNNAAFKLSKWDPNKDNGTNKDGTAKPKGGYVEVKDYKDEASNTKHTFEFAGLDDGKYKLEESQTPDGYNTWTALEFYIVAEHNKESDDPKLTSLKFYTEINEDGTGKTGKEINDFSGMVDSNKAQTGMAEYTVKNFPGSSLPETGGMGTVILYALGGAFVVAAGAWFAFRRRLSNR
ncbi:isopeptide-forming domain-containing fimbrial protein [Bifidobacterium simiiventris]|uniref:isopeptide-forming domain-containing fimbrial protein n=1 Tax=Bifidobacterium simiiventris TaxID=2834434 RepID=UPI001C55B427|nr:isopeptide-forming domain-containing fimbrial protein [Bifidobacterium simiiventris]MBW3078099.1 isopeptide-forming domain-containing fimbrial protein [Bifidobacterium simiiventris]